MMDHLLPVAWTDLATSAEVAATSAEVAQLRDWATIRFEHVDERFDLMEKRFDQMATKAEMERGFRRQTWALITATAAFDGLVLAAIRLV